MIGNEPKASGSVDLAPATIPRWLLTLTIIFLLGVLIGGLWLYRNNKVAHRRTIEANLAAIGRLKTEQIVQWRSERLADAAFIMEEAFFIEHAATALNRTATPTVRKKLLERFRSINTNLHYYDVLLIDPASRVWLSLSGTNGQVDDKVSAALVEAFRTRRPAIGDLHLGGDNETPHLEIIAPLFSGAGPEAAPIGAIVLRRDVRQFLYPMLQSWPVPSQSAETLILQRIGNEILFLNDLRHRQGAALNLRLPLNRTEVPGVAAALGKHGVVEGPDYRGVRVLAAIGPVPASSWFLVAKIDESEALAGWWVEAVLIVALLGTLLVAGSGALLVGWQRSLRQQYQARYQAEQALVQSTTQYRTLYESMRDAFVLVDMAGNLKEWNSAYSDLLGYTDDELRRLTSGDLTPPRWHAKEARILADQILPDGYSEVYDKEYRRKDGTIIPVELRTFLLRNEAGEPAGMWAIVRDLGQRRAAEAALKESEEKFRSLYTAMTEGMALHELVRDSSGTPVDYLLLDVNPAFESITGLPRQSVIGRRASKVYGTGAAPFLETYAEVATAGRPTHFETLFEPMQKVFSIMVFSPGQNRFATVFQDITARRAAEKESERLQAQFLQAQKMEAVGRLAGGVAHDFNNMLQAILGYTELSLHDVEPGSPLAENIREIDKAARRSADLTRQLLAFSRQQPASPKVLDLNETVTGMLKMLRRLAGEDIDLAWMPAMELRPVRIDPTQLDQILANLLVNARDAIASVGKVTIGTDNAMFDAAYCAEHPGFVPGEYAVLEVSDDGCGMDQETRAQLFEPFFTTKPVGQGTGLGLATVYGIVKQNNGFINVYSEPGQGSTFRVYLPLCPAEEPSPSEAGQSNQPPGGTETVLLVEDEEVILSLARSMLERLGYTVLAAPAPTEALRLAAEHAGQIALLITDVVMPEMNGRDLADRLTATNSDLRCLFMSGYTADVISHRGVLEADVLFLQKPFSLHALAAKVREALDASPSPTTT